MEKDLTARYVAIVEKCAITEVALRHILINESGKNYRIQFFKDTQALKREFQSKDFQVTADPGLKAYSFFMRLHATALKCKELS